MNSSGQVKFLKILKKFLKQSYSALMAAKGESFMALMEGRKPASMAISAAKTTATSASQGGITEILDPASNIASPRFSTVLSIYDIP
jgi:hypothetical protein